MTRFIHDEFAKDFLEELLSPYGEIKTPRRVSAEVREIDVWFAPSQIGVAIPNLGLLGRLAAKPALFEPFRNAATPNDICNCLLKLLILRGEFQREANRKKQSIIEEELPYLWILSPTLSKPILEGFGAKIKPKTWEGGIYFLADYLRTGIIVLHQLPETRETLWLRLLSKGKFQEKAIEELQQLELTNPLKSNILQLLTNLQAKLEAKQNIEEEERDLIMKLSPLYIKWREEAINEGIQQERRIMIENMLLTRFGAIDIALSEIIEPLTKMPPRDAIQLLMQSSKEEILAHFQSNQS